MTTLKQPIFCHCDLSFGEHKVDKSFDGTIPFGLWLGVCFLIVVAVVGVVMGVAVYRGAVANKIPVNSRGAVGTLNAIKPKSGLPAGPSSNEMNYDNTAYPKQINCGWEKC